MAKGSGGGTSGSGGRDGSGNPNNLDVGTVNPANIRSDNVYISSVTKQLAFVGDTKAKRILDSAEKTSPDYMYGMVETTRTNVPASKVRSLQPDIHLPKAKEYAARYKSGEKVQAPLTIKYKGNYYIRNGHHRAVAQLLNGSKTIDVRVVKGD